ncbi:hypothetical protein D3C79_606880 [compost metagenome]
MLLLILQRENTIDGPQFDVFIGDAVERHIGIMNMPLVIYDGAGFIMVFHQLLQLIVLGFQGQQVPIMLAPGGQTRIDLCQRGEIPAAEVILGGAAVTAQCAKTPPLHAADAARRKLGTKTGQQPHRAGNGIGADDPLAALVQIMIEPHILAMVLHIELLLGLSQPAGEELYSIALVIIPQ